MFLENPVYNNEQFGWIEVICGSMFSGKTEELIRRIKRAKIANQKIKVFKPVIDSRSKNFIESHDESKLECIEVKSSNEILKKIDNCDVVAIDEAQFFDDLVPFVRQKVNEGFIIVVAGLIGDFEQKPFGHILELLPLCDTITHLKSYCTVSKDGTLAPFTKRIVDSKEQELVGSEDMYTAVCRKYL